MKNGRQDIPKQSMIDKQPRAERDSLSFTELEEEETRPHYLPLILLGALAIVVIIAAGAFIILPQTGGHQAVTTNGGGNSTDTSSSPSGNLPTLTTGAMRTAHVKAYKIAQADAGLMQPTIDQQGHLWFGEMSLNRLGQLDTSTGHFTDWPLDSGQYGVMNTAIDAQSNVWFAEQTGNYIGRFTPQTRQFKRFPLPTAQGKSIGVQDLHFDASGQLWFTALSSSQLGRLDVKTGAIRFWTLPTTASGSLYPNTIAITANGQIWIGMLSGGVIARFEPGSGQFTIFPLADSQAEVSSMTSDGHGHIWFAEMHKGVLGEIDTSTNKITERQIILPGGGANNTPTLAGLAIASDGSIWLAYPDGSTLLRYQPGETHYTTVRLDQANSKPFALTSDTQGRLWFTMSGTASFIGQINTQES